MKLAWMLILMASNVWAIDVQRFQPMSERLSVFSSYRSIRIEEGSLDVGIYYNYARNPIEFGNVKDKTRLDEIIDSLNTVNLGLGYGFSDNLTLLANIRTSYIQDFEEVNSEEKSNQLSTIDDLFLGAMFNWARFPSYTVLPYLILPTGKKDILLSEENGAFGFKFIKDWGEIEDKNYYNINFGPVFRTTQSILNLDVGTALSYSLAYERLLSRDSMFKLGVELMGEFASPGVENYEVSSPMELILGVKRYIPAITSSIKAGVGKGLTLGYGAPDYRLFVGLSFMFKSPYIFDENIPKRKIVKKRTVRNESIKFIFDKDFLTAEGHETLTNVVATSKTKVAEEKERIAKKIAIVESKKVLAQFDMYKNTFSYKYQLGGHTDQLGPDLYNDNLSMRRVLNTENFIKTLDPRFDAVTSFHGESKLLFEDTSISKRRENRRVDVKLEETEVYWIRDFAYKKFPILNWLFDQDSKVDKYELEESILKKDRKYKEFHYNK